MKELWNVWLIQLWNLHHLSISVETDVKHLSISMYLETQKTKIIWIQGAKKIVVHGISYF